VLRERRRVEQTELDFEGAFIITGLCCRVMRSYSYCLYNTLSVSYSIRLLAIGIYINSGGFCWRRFFFLFYIHFHIQWPLDDDFWSLCWLILQLCDYISFCIEATTNKQRLSRVIFTFLLYLWLALSMTVCLYLLVRTHDDSFCLYGTAAVAAIVFNFLVVFLAAESVYNKRRRLKTDDHNIWETTLCVYIQAVLSPPQSLQ
jgi:hypothetical protein